MTTIISDPFSVSVVAAGSVTVDYPIAAYGQSAILFTVRIPTASGSDTNFTYTTQNSGTGDDYAAAGTDYTTTSGIGTITAGDLYTQISVPIASNAPPNGRHEFEFSINGGAVVSTGVIIDAIHINDFDYPSIGALKKLNWERDNQLGSWTNNDLIATHPEAFYTSGVNASTNRLTLLSPPHSLSNGDAIRFSSKGSSLPAPINITTTYYAKSIDTSTIEVYYDQALTAIVDLTTVGEGTHYIHTTAMILSDIPAAVGVNCLLHDMETSEGVQGTYGVDSLSTTLAGDMFDGEEYYYSWWMKIVAGFIWVGDGQDKMKCGRMVSTDTAPNYTTTYIQGSRLYWPLFYPTAGNNQQTLSLFNFAGQDDEWHEYVFYQKRESSYALSDGIVRFVVDGVLDYEELNIGFTDKGFTEPGGTTGVRISNMGLFAWFQNQIGAQFGTDHTGGQIYTDGHICTKGHWPSAKYARPW